MSNRFGHGGLLLLAISLASTTTAKADSKESIRGTVIDATTGSPIAGAIVITADTAAIADGQGRFELATESGDVQLTAEATGYDPTELTVRSVDRARPLTVVLSPADAEGEVVVITGRAPDTGRAATYEIETEELRSLPGAGNDALKSLQSLPGVSRVPYGAGGLVLRGTNPRDTNVYLDGVEVPILYHFGGLASFYPSAMLETIDLAPGGFGVGYGRAQGGLVTLESRRGRTDRWRVASEVSLIDASLRADGPGFGGGAWSLGLRRSYVDAVLALALPEDSDLELTVAPRYYDAQLRYDVDLGSRDSLSVMMFGADDQLALAIEPDEPADPDDPDKFSFGQSFARLAARWRRRVDSTVLTATPWIGFEESAIRVGDQGLTRTAYPMGLRADVTTTFERGLVAGGIDVQGGRYDLYLKNEPPPMPGVDNDLEVTRETRDWSADVGFWLEALYKIEGGALAVRPGVRAERYGLSDEWVLDPRVTISHQLPAGIRLKESVGIYHQPPAQSDGDWGNPDLMSSYSTQASVGVEAPLPGGVDVAVTGFSQESYRLPVDVVSSASAASAGGTPQSGGAGAASAQFLEEQFGQWSYRENVGRGRSYGSELLVKRAGERFYGWLSYTWSRSLRRGDPQRFYSYTPYVLDQPHVLTALGSVRLGRHWRLGARVRYASGNPFTPVADTYFDTDTQSFLPVDGDILSARLPAFFQLDARVDREWRRRWGTIALFLDVQNVTNRLNPEGFEYNYDYSQLEYRRGLPVFPSIGVEYRP